jgi:hypothetical protein
MYLPRSSFKQNFMGGFNTRMSVDTADSHVQETDLNILKLTVTGSQEYSQSNCILAHNKSPFKKNADYM